MHVSLKWKSREVKCDRVIDKTIITLELCLIQSSPFTVNKRFTNNTIG